MRKFPVTMFDRPPKPTPTLAIGSAAKCMVMTAMAELIDAIRLRTASVVVRGDCITGYTSAIAFFGHAVAETNADLMAMIAAAPEFGGPGFACANAQLRALVLVPRQ